MEATPGQISGGGSGSKRLQLSRGSPGCPGRQASEPRLQLRVRVVLHQELLSHREGFAPNPLREFGPEAAQATNRPHGSLRRLHHHRARRRAARRYRARFRDLLRRCRAGMARGRRAHPRQANVTAFRSAYPARQRRTAARRSPTSRRLARGGPSAAASREGRPGRRQTARAPVRCGGERAFPRARGVACRS
jgi:hypothetical protein